MFVVPLNMKESDIIIHLIRGQIRILKKPTKKAAFN